ncbi:EF hand, partial [Teladorsagia circumcincta]
KQPEPPSSTGPTTNGSQLGMECIRESELRELFREFDKNGDGKITREELEMALIQLGERPSSSHIEAIINQTDIDG